MKLNKQVKFYVPSNRKGGQFDNKQLLESVASQFGLWFGGSTATTGTGYWLSGTKLVSEPVFIVSAFTNETKLQEKLGDIYGLAAETRDNYEQDAIAVEIDGILELI